ncbi:MAG: DUF2149 domain-containing protein [Methanobacteriaceae archaeon]|nr:DUF2149 domain-containing protein [Methanobacteriaceae archaeon]
MLRKRKKLLESEDDDPMSGIANLSDAMLVLALGFLIFAIMALSTHPDIISDVKDSQSSQNVVTGDSFTNDSSTTGEVEDKGYNEVGKVFKDPETGDLVMVSN